MFGRSTGMSVGLTAGLIWGALGVSGAAAAPSGALRPILSGGSTASTQVAERGFQGCPGGGGMPGDFGTYRCYKGYGGGGFYYGPGPYSFGGAGEPMYYGVFSRPDHPRHAATGCEGLHAKAVDTGSKFWWRKYHACTG